MNNKYSNLEIREIKINTVLDNSFPESIIRKHRGTISVDKRKSITSIPSFLIRAPITPRQVKRKYSNERPLWLAFKQGYRYKGIWATKINIFGQLKIPCKNGPWVIGCEAIHCIKAKELHTLVDDCELREGGDNNG